MPAPARIKRLTRELADCHKDDDIVVQQVGDSMDHFIGSFNGPTGTAYEGGRFDVDIVAPERYPFEPLKIKFITKVYHPNISSASGYICLDILNKSWSPVYTLRTCLVSLQSLLSSPEPTDPQDAEVAKHYLTDRRGFEATAKFWTETYAHPQASSTTPTPGSRHGTQSSTTGSEPSTSNPGSRSSSRSRRARTGPVAAVPPRAQTPQSVNGRRDDSNGGRSRSFSPEKEEQEQEEEGRGPNAPTDGPKTLARLAGVDWRDVQAFTEMGFPPEHVIETLQFLNYRDGNKANVGEEAVVLRLMG